MKPQTLDTATSAPACLCALLALALAVLNGPAPASAQPTWGKPPSAPRDPAQPAPPLETPRESPPDTPSAGPAQSPPPSPSWRADDPPRAEPSWDLAPGGVYTALSDDGLRYAYRLPLSFQRGRAFDLTILLHPDGENFRWGLAAHAGVLPDPDGGPPRPTFRPDDIVIAVDGSTIRPGRGDQRRFVAAGDGVVRFRDFVLETSRRFPVRGIALYGYGAGGRFALTFAAAFPALAEGVVAHAAGAPPEAVKKQAPPYVFLHGAGDPTTPLHESLDAARRCALEGHSLARVRILPNFNDFTNPVRADECIEWCLAMRTADAERALAGARRLLEPKPADEFGYRAPVWFGAARQILDRFAGTGRRALKNPPPELAAQAQAMIDLIEAQAGRHVAVLSTDAPASAADAALDGRPWLGHLLQAREDFRGVAAFDAFAARFGLDEAMETHAAVAIELIEAVPRAESARATLAPADLERIAELLPRCFLYYGSPADLPGRVRATLRAAEREDAPLADELLEKTELVTNWEKGLRAGLEQYADLWQRWQAPPVP